MQVTNKSFLFLLLCFLCKLSWAASVYAPLTLYDYIGDQCKVLCADQEEVLDSTSKASRDHNLEQTLLLAVIAVESKFGLKARNGKTDLSLGLMQVNVRWHKAKFKTRNYFDVQQNVEVGASVLDNCMDKHRRNVRKALLCYNGYGNKQYPAKVFAAWKQIKRLVDLDRS